MALAITNQAFKSHGQNLNTQGGAKACPPNAVSETPSKGNDRETALSQPKTGPRGVPEVSQPKAPGTAGGSSALQAASLHSA